MTAETGNGATVRMKRTRRVLVTALVALVVLMLLAFLALLRIFEPVGAVARGEAAKGISWQRSIYGWGNTRGEQLGSPQNVAVGPDGTIWVTDAGMARVIAFRPDGSYKTLLHQGPRGSSDKALSFPSSVAVDEDGLVYIGDMTASEVVVMSPDNKVVRRIAVPRPRSVAVRGDVLVVGSAAGFAVMEKTGELTTLVGQQGAGEYQFDGVSGLAIGEDQTVYVVDQYNNRVSAYTPTGQRKWMVVTGGRNSGTSPADSMRSRTTTAEAGMQLPAGITIDNAGRLVVADAFGFELVALDSKTGKLLGKYGTAGVQDGQFVYPGGIAYDPARDHFVVADTSMSRVQVVRLPGSGGSPVAAANRAMLGPARIALVPLGVLAVAGATWAGARRFRLRSAAAPA